MRFIDSEVILSKLVDNMELLNILFTKPKDGLWLYCPNDQSFSVTHEMEEMVQLLKSKGNANYIDQQFLEYEQKLIQWASSLPISVKPEFHEYSYTISNSTISKQVRYYGTKLFDKESESIVCIGIFSCSFAETETSRLSFNDQNLLNKIIHNESVFVLIIDSLGKYTYVNDYFLAFFNYAPNEVIGTSSLLGIVEEDLQKCLDAATFCQLNPNKKIKIELTKFIKNKYSTAAWEFVGINDDQGLYSYTFCIGYDITEQKHQEKELKTSEQKFRTLVENNNDIIYQIDKNLNLTYISPSVEAILGISASELHNNGYFQYLNSYNTLLINNLFRDLFDSPKTIDNIEIEVKDIYLNSVWLHGSMSSVIGKNGEVEFLTGIARNNTALKLKEKELQASEEKYRLIVQNSIDIIFQVDLEGNFIFVSDSYARIFNQDISLLKGKSSIDFTHPEDQPKILSKIAEVVESGKNLTDFEFRALHPDGNYYWYRTNCTPLYSAEGEIIGISGVSSNINDLKKLELAYEKAATQAKLGNWEYDLQTGKITWSSMVYVVHEVDTSVTPTMEFVNYLFDVKSSKQLFTDAVSNCIKNGIGYDIELQTRTPEGKIKWVRTIAEPVFNEGTCVKLIGTVQDITEKKHNELQLQDAHEFNESILNTIPDFMFILNQDGTFLHWIAGKEDELLMPPDLFIGKNVVDVLPPPLGQQVLQSLKKSLRTKDIVTMNYELPIGLQTNYYEARFNPISKDTLLVLSRNITDKLKSEEEKQELMNKVKQQNHALQNYSFIMSHNLKSLSANISGILYLMKEHNMINEENEFFSHLMLAASNLNDFTKNISETTSFFTNTDLLLENIKLKDIVKLCIDNNYSTIHEYSVKIDCFVSDNHIVYANKIYTENILYNLLTNAIKYKSNKRPSRITLSSSYEKNFIHFQITDNGLGIDLDRYGLKLFGLMKTFHNHPEARGIGLFMVKNQIEVMGGKIEVESQVDVGTTFHVYFPKAKD